MAARHPFCSKKYTEGEENIINILKKNFPSALHIEVADISGLNFLFLPISESNTKNDYYNLEV